MIDFVLVVDTEDCATKGKEDHHAGESPALDE